MALWGEEAPASAVKTVQVHVSRLRQALEDPPELTTTPAGYRLDLPAEGLDAARFEALLAQGRPAEALALWRGPALAELAYAPFAQDEIARLEERRLEALDALAEADLAAGRHRELAGELQRRAAEHPLRERTRAQL